MAVTFNLLHIIWIGCAAGTLHIQHDTQVKVTWYGYQTKCQKMVENKNFLLKVKIFAKKKESFSGHGDRNRYEQKQVVFWDKFVIFSYVIIILQSPYKTCTNLFRSRTWHWRCIKRYWRCRFIRISWNTRRSDYSEVFKNYHLFLLFENSSNKTLK